LSTQLKLTDSEGLRLRQQSATDVEHVKTVQNDDGTAVVQVVKSKDWKFDKLTDYEGRPVDFMDQDRDVRLVDGAGKKMKLGTYSPHITAGTRNLVVERKGKVKSLDFLNRAIRNQLRIKYQELKDTGRKTKDGKPIHQWEDAPGQPVYVAPNTWGGAFVGDNQRAIIEELPT
jgi:hypothetical protein